MGSQQTFRRTAGSPADIPAGNVARLFLDAVDRYDKSDALRYKHDGVWNDLSHRLVYQNVKEAALGLEALGLEAGDRVGIISQNRPEWLISDFACVMARTLSVPLYPVLPGDQIAHQLEDSGAKLVFVSDAEQLEKVRVHRSHLPALEHIVSFDPRLAEIEGVMSMRELLQVGAARTAEVPDDEYRSRALAADPHDVLTIIYTSGTTGQPKGVVLTHNNLVSNVRSVLMRFEIDDADVSLSVLPLSHIFERMAGHYVMVSAGVTICYAESFATAADDLLATRPTVMTLVPRGYEKIYDRVQEVAREGGSAKVTILRWATRVGVRHLGRRLEDESVGPILSLGRWLADRVVFSKIRGQMGGRIRFFVSGGAPLNREIARFFLSADLPILEGYGLTETSPVIAFNTPDEIKLGTVGKPIPGVEVAIAEDGEILTRGPHVMKGYYKMPEATASVIDDYGWFHTGDIGELDDEGFLSITDRKKDLIVTAGGKNIAPQPIENRVQTNAYVNQVVMIGDQRRFPALVIVPDFEALESWAAERGIQFSNREELVRNPDVIQFMEGEILGSFDDLARHEQPKKLALLPRELTVDAGEVTPTLKVKRRAIETRHRDIIEALYRES